MDTIWDYDEQGHRIESHVPPVFIFQLENIWQSNLNFSTSYGRLTDLKSFLGLLLVSFIWHEEKDSLN